MFQLGPTDGSYLYDPLAPNTPIVREEGNLRLSDSTYAEVVQAMPIPCVDTLFVLRKENGTLDRALYLAHRSVYPMLGVWHFGGRIMFNDQGFKSAIVRAIERETNVRFEEDRFTFVRQAFYSWVKTAQGDFFGKNVATTFVCVIDSAELEAIREGIIASEYVPDFGVQRFTRKRLVDENCHQVFVDMFDTLFPSPKQRRQAARAILNNTWWQGK